MADLKGGTNISGNMSIDTDLVVNGTNAATSTSTGALQVAGGAGISGNVIAGGNVSALVLRSNIATGTAPIVVSSTTQVANLNAALAGTVTTNAQPNITSVGTLSSLSVSGNTTSGNFIGALSNGNSNVSIATANGNITMSVGGTANVVTVTSSNVQMGTGSGGNISGANVITANIFNGITANMSSNSYFAVSSGNVGIGTTSPVYKLQVSGTVYGDSYNFGSDQNLIYQAAADKVGFRVGTSTNQAFAALTGTGSGVIMLDGAGGVLAFGTSATERMRITSTGNVGIGTTSVSYNLQLANDSAAKPSTNTWTIASDERIKTVTGEYTKGLSAVCDLRPVTYKYNGAAGFVADDKEHISIIAQEAMIPFPECVGTFEAELNDDDETTTELYNWNGHALTFALVNAIKELKAINEELAARISKLEGK